MRTIKLHTLILVAAVACAVPCAHAQDAVTPDSTAWPAPAGTFAVEKTFGGYGVGPGQLDSPAGIAVDPLGRILVADTGNHRVARFDSGGVYVSEFGGFGYDTNRFDRPTSIFVGGTLGVWVLDQGNARVVKYDLDGRVLGVVVDLRSEAVRARLDVVDPVALSADTGGELYLTDRAADRIVAFDPLGSVLGIIGRFGNQPGRFARPSGVAVDTRGRVLVGDGGNKRVQLLDSFGGFVRAYPVSPGMSAKDGLAVAFGPDSTWAVLDRASGGVSLRTLAGEELARWVPKKGDPRGSALAFDRQGRLLLTDTRASKVSRLRPTAAAP